MSLARVITNQPTRVANVLNGIFLFLIGVWILLPWPAFDHRPAWRVASQIADERIWAAILIVAGIIKLVAALHSKWEAQAFSSWIGFIVWFAISFSWWVSDWQSPICIIGTYLAIQSAHHYIMSK